MIYKEALYFDCSETNEVEIFTIDLKLSSKGVIRHGLRIFSEKITLKVSFIVNITAEIMYNWLSCNSEGIMIKFIAFRIVVPKSIGLTHRQSFFVDLNKVLIDAWVLDFEIKRGNILLKRDYSSICCHRDCVILTKCISQT